MLTGPNKPAGASANAIPFARSRLRWPCFVHEWIEVERHDDLVCERCVQCDKQRRWQLPIDLDAP